MWYINIKQILQSSKLWSIPIVSLSEHGHQKISATKHHKTTSHDPPGRSARVPPISQRSSYPSVPDKPRHDPPALSPKVSEFPVPALNCTWLLSTFMYVVKLMKPANRQRSNIWINIGNGAEMVWKWYRINSSISLVFGEPRGKPWPGRCDQFAPHLGKHLVEFRRLTNRGVNWTWRYQPSQAEQLGELPWISWVGINSSVVLWLFIDVLTCKH